MLKFKFLWSWVWAFLKPIIALLLSELGRALADAARAAVLSTEKLPPSVSNDQRRKVAYDLVVKDMENIGHTVGTKITVSMIYAAIELALQAIKAEA